MAAKLLYTVGHSTRTLEDFVDLLAQHGVRAVGDVRRFPGSRKYPHFNVDALARSLPAVGIRYVPLPALGGRRRAAADSPNTGWRNEGFRGYADHMQTAEFAAGLDELVAVAGELPTAIMCAEAVPWRCHRSLIADAMLVRGWDVLDLTGPRAAKPHRLTPFARVDGTRIVYPPGPAAPGT
jgi:uncharacterized protein (DUF488 family)